MFGLIDAIKNANAAVRAGNEYRREKYGEPEGYWESAKRDRAFRKSVTPKTLSMFASIEELEEIDKFKAHFEYWDEWSGARYVKRKNPNPTENTVKVTTCRSNAVTGYWEAI